LRRGEVERLDAGSYQWVPGGVAVLQVAAIEGGGVEPAGGIALAARDLGLLAGYQIGPLPQAVDILAVAALRHVEGEAALHVDKSAELPATQQDRRGTFQVLGERQVPHVADHQSLAMVEDAGGSLGASAMACILALAGAAIRTLSGVVDKV